MSMQSADTRTLVTLLQLRKLAEASGRHINVVSEMADARNRALAEVTRADDFVVSNQLVSLMLAQASENPFLSAIFAELLDEEGSEVYIRPITDYVAIDRPVTFYTIVEAARRRGEVAFGFKETVSDRGARNMGGVIINPRRAEARTFNATDSVVVLARG
jgi:DNA-binding GntR family transcriptional regulator